MGEFNINPVHNVHKKYRQVNFVNPYIFTPPVVVGAENTFIGGVSSVINTPASLASKLAIDVSRISNFSVVGSDIKCRITGSYIIQYRAFKAMTITNYLDLDNLVTDIATEAFANIPNPCFLSFKAIIFLTGTYITSLSRFMMIELNNCTSIVDSAFGDFTSSILYAPRCTNLGLNSLNNSVFAFSSSNKIYCHSSLITSNSGGVEGDIAFAISTGGVISYVANFTVPNVVNTLSVGTIYNTAIQLNFTAPSSANAIEYYECYANGVFKNKITESGQYITGLASSTTYAITIIAVDVFYNKSAVSNVFSVTTTVYLTPSSYTDTNANAYISAAGITALSQESVYQLIVDLKTVGLYSKVQAFYPFKGTTSASHKFNGKNPVNTDAGFRLIFNGSGTFSESGYLTNGSNAYADSKFIPSENQTVNNNGITVVVGTNNAPVTDAREVGSYISNSQASLLGVKINNTTYSRRSWINGTIIEQTGFNESRGVFTGVKTSSTVQKLFRNGSLISIGNSGGTLPNISQWIGALNATGSAYGYSNQRIQMVLFHEGLSDSEVATLHSIIDLSESIAGRKTW